MGLIDLEDNLKYFELIGAGSLSGAIAGNSLLGVTSNEVDTLVQTNQNNWNLWGGKLGLSYVYFISSASKYSEILQWFPKIAPGLNVYYSHYNNEGTIYRFNDPVFDALVYSIPINSTRLMFDGSLTVASWRQISTYITGGIGNAWNRIGYTDNASSSFCNIETIHLNNNFSSNFVWETGAGLTYDLGQHLAISFEYLYTDFGRLSTSGIGNTPGISTPLISPASFQFSAQGLLLGLRIAA